MNPTTDIAQPSHPLPRYRWEQTEFLRGTLAIAGATLGMASGFGLLILSSVFVGPLVAEHGWSRADISLGYVCAAMGMAAGGMVWGSALDRIDMRWLLFVGGLFQVLPLASLASAQNLTHFLGAHLLLGFFGFGALYAPYVAVASDWFPARRGIVMGIVTAGGAVGQGSIPYLADTLIGSLGWRQSYLALAAGIALIQVAVFLTVRHRTPRQRSSSTVQRRERSLTPRLLTLSAAAFFCCVCMGMPLFHLAGFVTLICGSSSLGATSLLIAMLSGAVGRIAFGHLADKVGCYRTYQICAAAQAASLVFFPSLTGASSLMVLSAIFGFAFSGNMTCMLLCIRLEATPSRLGAAIGFILFVAWAGMAAGGYLGGALFDATSSFTSAFSIAAVAGVVAFLLLCLLQLAPDTLRLSRLTSFST